MNHEIFPPGTRAILTGACKQIQQLSDLLALIQNAKGIERAHYTLQLPKLHWAVQAYGFKIEALLAGQGDLVEESLVEPQTSKWP